MLEQISGTGYTGGRVVHPDSLTVDYALESQAVTDVATAIGGQTATWRGRAAVVRMAGSSVEQYLLRRGRSFRWGGWGFLAAAQDVSANIRGCGGRLRNNNTGSVNVTFFQPGLTAVAVNGVVAPSAGSTAAIPPGESTVALLTAPTFGAGAATYVQGGRWATMSFDGQSTLIVKADLNEDYQREAFLRIDLGAHAGGAVDTTYLVLHAEETGGNACTLELSEVSNDMWAKAVTWESTRALSSGKVLDTVAAPAEGGRVAFDITRQVNALLTGTGDRLMSVRLRVLENGANNSVTFASPTHSLVDHRPGLHLTPNW